MRIPRKKKKRLKKAFLRANKMFEDPTVSTLLGFKELIDAGCYTWDGGNVLALSSGRSTILNFSNYEK